MNLMVLLGVGFGICIVALCVIGWTLLRAAADADRDAKAWSETNRQDWS